MAEPAAASDRERDARPIIALVPGDPTGIGPEQTARLLAGGELASVARILLVGDARIIAMGMAQAGVRLELAPVGGPGDADWSAAAIPIVDLANLDPASLAIGAPDPAVGRVVGATLAAAVDLAKAGAVDAITFAPLNKQALHAGGWRFPDEHQLFAHLLGHQGPFSEMNVLETWWMGRVTSHLSLREAIDGVTHERICYALRLVDATLRRAGIARPRIAVAALNPHAGEGGLFGREEIEIIRPAVEAMAADGIACSGPFPADTVYLKAFDGQFDSVLAMYHDQGQIATKLKGFNRGVTVTAGLETVFTTPAHGTAYDIAGKGAAHIGALEQAVRLAARLAPARSAGSAG
ncbi:4-hydroxythreonine-4-phosphate dehydrogenase PdxA [soil metagenome]